MRPACAAIITFLNVGLPVGAKVHEPSRRRAENHALPRSTPTVFHVVFAGSKSCTEQYGNVRPGDPESSGGENIRPCIQPALSLASWKSAFLTFGQAETTGLW